MGKPSQKQIEQSYLRLARHLLKDWNDSGETRTTPLTSKDFQKIYTHMPGGQRVFKDQVENLRNSSDYRQPIIDTLVNDGIHPGLVWAFKRLKVPDATIDKIFASVLDYADGKPDPSLKPHEQEYIRIMHDLVVKAGRQRGDKPGRFSNSLDDKEIIKWREKIKAENAKKPPKPRALH